MGRLDDAAKRKVVELRKNGLSFRKIKAVLELENIKVSAQAIYLFLKEFQGKQGAPEEGAAPLALVGTRGSQGGRREGWSNLHLQQLLRDASRHAGYVAAAEFAKQGPTPEARRAQPSGSAATSGASRPEHPDGEKDDIQIVSVTSLAQNSQQRGAQPTVQRAGSGTAGVTVTGAYMRRRVTPSPATNPILAARKRLLDKALSHRIRLKESYQQVASVLRKDQANSSGPEARRIMTAQPQPQSYDPTAHRIAEARRNADAQPGGAGVPRRLLQPVRSPHPLPRVDIRLPSPASAAPASQGPIQIQTPAGQGPGRREGNPSPQQVAQKAGGMGGGGGGGGGGGSGLQEQVQALGSEVRSLGLAVRMLAEQQVQQTQVQRQILSALQTLASSLGTRNHAPGQQQQQQQLQQHHTKTPSPSSLPAPAPASYAQDTFAYSQGTYPAQCSQAQPGFPEMDAPGLDTIEAFKLPGLSPEGVNGFAPCGGDSIPLTHAPASHAESYTPTYAYSQTYVPAYGQSHAQTYREAESNGAEYRGACAAGTLRDCSAASQPALTPDSPLTLASQEDQINIIKVETL